MENPDSKLTDMQPTVDECYRVMDDFAMRLTARVLSALRRGDAKAADELRAAQAEFNDLRSRLGA